MTALVQDFKYISNYSSFTCKKKLSWCSCTWRMVVLLECSQGSCTLSYLHLLKFNHTYKLCTWSSKYRILETIPLPSLHPRFRRKLVTPNHPKSTIDLLGKNTFWIWFFPSNSDAICRYLKMEGHTLECFCWMLWSPTCRRQSTTWCTSKSLRHLPSWLSEAYSCLMTVPEFMSNHWRSEGKPIQCLGKQNMK